MLEWPCACYVLFGSCHIPEANELSASDALVDLFNLHREPVRR